MEPVRTEFPALEARKGFLEQEYYQAKRTADSETFSSKPQGSTQQWLAGIRAELDELTYVLKWVYGQLDTERATVSRHTLLFLVGINATIIVAIIYLYMRP